MTAKKPATKKTATTPAQAKTKSVAKPRTKKAVASKPVIVHGFKGFDKNLKCRDMQYGLGKTFETDDAVLCSKGLHFCEYPLDCFYYYEPGLGSKYAAVTAENPLDKTDNDSKRVTKKLTISVELSLNAMVDAAVKFIFEKINWEDKKESNTGYRSAATNTGNCSAASVEGKHSVAIATGYKSRASACLGSWIVLTERNNNGEILNMRCGKIDGETLKPDTFYTLVDGEFTEATND
jgi:hypothetical protein